MDRYKLITVFCGAIIHHC